MSRKPRTTPENHAASGRDGRAGPSLAPNPELEAALREASDAIDHAGKPEVDVDVDSELNPEPEVLLTHQAHGEFIDEELERIREELLQTKDQHLRLQADFENFRRRAIKERQELLQYGHENLVKDLLSTVDNLDRAIAHAQQSSGGDLESLLQGVEMLQRELFAILEKHSVTEINAMGEAFDPALHEAMAQSPDASVDPNTIIDVLQKGYQLRGRLLRPARVVVARKPQESEVDGGEAG